MDKNKLYCKMYLLHEYNYTNYEGGVLSGEGGLGMGVDIAGQCWGRGGVGMRPSSPSLREGWGWGTRGSSSPGEGGIEMGGARVIVTRARGVGGASVVAVGEGGLGLADVRVVFARHCWGRGDVSIIIVVVITGAI